MDSRVVASLFLIVSLFVLTPNFAQAKAQFENGQINIWSSGSSQWVDTCADLLKVTGNTSVIANSCNSPFASTCVSVLASINITRGGATNWTNFTVDGCELRMNLTAAGQGKYRNITSWGNFSILNSNITTGGVYFIGVIGGIVIEPNSNFSMKNSFIQRVGYSTATVGRMGLELNSPVFGFSNNTVNYDLNAQGANGVVIHSGASGSIINGFNTMYDLAYGVSVEAGVSNISLNDVNSSFCVGGTPSIGILVDAVSNSTFTNINTSYNDANFYLAYSNNNTFKNITTISSVIAGQAGFYIWTDSTYSNNTIEGLFSSYNTYGLIILSDGSVKSKNEFKNLILNHNQIGVFANNNYNDVFVNVTAYDCSGTGMSFSVSNNNTVNTAKIYNCSLGMSLDSSNFNTISNLNISNSTSYGISLTTSSVWNYIVDSRINNTGFAPNLFDVYLLGNSINNTFLNDTYDKESVASGSLDRLWRFHIKAIDSLSSPISGANASVVDQNGLLINYTTTNTTGEILKNIMLYTNINGIKTYNTTYYGITVWNYSFNKQTQTDDFNSTAYNGTKNIFSLTNDVDVPTITNFTKTPFCVEVNNFVSFQWNSEDDGSDIAYTYCNVTDPVGQKYNYLSKVGSYLIPNNIMYFNYCNVSTNLTGDYRFQIKSYDKSGNVMTTNYFFPAREYLSCSGGSEIGTSGGNAGTGSSTGAPSTVIIVGNPTFMIYPTDITKLVTTGEHALIDTGNGHTLSIRNTAPNTIYLSVETKGDYASFISIEKVQTMQVLQQTTYIEVQSGKTVLVDLYDTIPMTAVEGSYPVVVIVQDRDTKASKSITVNLVISPLTSITKLAGKLITGYLIPLNATNSKVEMDFFGLPLPLSFSGGSLNVQSSTEFSFPIGWAFFIVVHYLFYRIFKGFTGLAYKAGKVRSKIMLTFEPLINYGLSTALIMWVLIVI